MPLLDRTLHSLEELNAAIRSLFEQHSRPALWRLPYSRRELFEKIEQNLPWRRCRHPLPLLSQVSTRSSTRVLRAPWGSHHARQVGKRVTRPLVDST